MPTFAAVFFACSNACTAAASWPTSPAPPASVNPVNSGRVGEDAALCCTASPIVAGQPDALGGDAAALPVGAPACNTFPPDGGGAAGGGGGGPMTESRLFSFSPSSS